MCRRCDEFKIKHPYDLVLKRHLDSCLGSEIICAFDNNGLFKTDNWNCQTINILRDMVERHGETKRDDDSAGSLDVLLIPKNDTVCGYLIMSYYKQRGRIGWAYIFNDDNAPEILTEKYADAIIDIYSELQASQDVRQ